LKEKISDQQKSIDATTADKNELNESNLNKTKQNKKLAYLNDKLQVAEIALTLRNLKQEKQISIESNETTELNESIRCFRCNITSEITKCETFFNII
jgi:hypothetical protein